MTDASLTTRTVRQYKKSRDAIKPKVQAALDAGLIQEVIHNLTERQRRFVEEYIVDYNGAAAVLRAGYTTKHAPRLAHEMLQHPGIKAAIDALTLDRAKNTTLKPEYVMNKIKRTIEKAEVANNYNAVLRGCELLARALGMFIERHEVSGPDGKAIEIEQRTKQEAENLIASLQNLASTLNKNNKKKEIVLNNN